MLTIFSTPKPFTGHNDTIQRNAITSWKFLDPAVEIFLLGDDEGTSEIAEQSGTHHIPSVERSRYGTPLVPSLFSIAENSASYDLLCYVNADIILLNDFLPAIRNALQDIREDKFLLIGQRWDFEIDELIDFEDTSWEEKIRRKLDEKGQLHAKTGMDYFIFPKGLYPEIPRFALGRTSWDNWLVYQARFLRATVVDITRAVTVIHQNHDYQHLTGNRAEAFKGPEALENQKLLGGWEYSFNTNNATKVLTEDGVKKNLSLRHLSLELDVIPVLHPRLRFLGVLRRVKMAVLIFVGRLLNR